MGKNKKTETIGRKVCIYKFYEKNKLTFVIAVLCLIFSSLLNLLLAYLFQELIDSAYARELNKLVRLIAVSAAYIIFVALNGVILNHARNNFIEKAMKQYKKYAYESITKKSISSFANEATSRYISVLTNDSFSIEQNYLQGTINLIAQSTVFIAAFLMMLCYNLPMTLIAISLSLIPILITIKLGKQIYIAEYKVSSLNEGFVGLIKDMLTGFSVIKSFKAENETIQIYDRQNALVEKTKSNRRKVEAFIVLISGLAGTCVHIAIFIFGTYLAIKGVITIGVVIAFVQLMNYILQPINMVPSLIANRKAAIGLIDKLVEIMQENSESKGTCKLEEIGNGIICEDLKFSYNEGETVLNGLNLNFEKGKSYAIVGASGSGKTTLLNLLLGGYDNYSGKITYGGLELREINRDSLYDFISVIQQNVFVFDSTIKNNITMFKNFAPDQIESAVQRAGLTELIKIKGDNYLCGENGAGLSGGEKQRISIARSLLKNTPVLIMDEATAALDNATAYNVENAILQIDGLTRIIVTHKLDNALLERFDEILVFSGGRVIETGNFKDLMAEDTYFRSLFTVSKCEAC